jgi:hypothetical protein
MQLIQNLHKVEGIGAVRNAFSAPSSDSVIRSRFGIYFSKLYQYMTKLANMDEQNNQLKTNITLRLGKNA